MTENMKRLDTLFDELVPAEGKADSLAGEMVRAISKIGYRFFNDGDQIGIGYGRETCNPPARFLKNRGDERISTYVTLIWGLCNKDVYEELLDVLVGAVVDYVETHPELRHIETEDMYDSRNPEEDRDYDEEDDEDC